MDDRQDPAGEGVEELPLDGGPYAETVDVDDALAEEGQAGDTPAAER
ncbi:MAG TPA: hypothetical protein VE991_14705 [Acidimicrobiales bacterium]|nr:hypothetical protein [Acidimicrobiales bacterium]